MFSWFQSTVGRERQDENIDPEWCGGGGYNTSQSDVINNEEGTQPASSAITVCGNKPAQTSAAQSRLCVLITSCLHTFIHSSMYSSKVIYNSWHMVARQVTCAPEIIHIFQDLLWFFLFIYIFLFLYYTLKCSILLCINLPTLNWHDCAESQKMWSRGFFILENEPINPVCCVPCP